MYTPELHFEDGLSKEKNMCRAKMAIEKGGLEIASYDFNRLWGGFFTLSENTETKLQFLRSYYPKQYNDFKDLDITPKILILAPLQSTSFQYHKRRSEIHRIIAGPVGIVKSPDNTYPDHYPIYVSRQIEKLEVEERHQLIGARRYTAVAEIWIHTDPGNRSDEDDITRIELPPKL